MRKNKLSHAEMISLSKEDALALFQSTYDIDPATLDIFLDSLHLPKLTHFDRAYEAAHFIYESAIQAGLEKNESLAQITAVNLAALITDWNDPLNNQRSLGSKIRRHYGDLVHQSGANSIALLRQDVLKNTSEGSIILNMFNEEKNPTNILFSKHDLVDGVKLPSKLTTDLSYLLGIYRADGSIGRPHKNEFYIQGRNDDFFFYTSILEDKLEDTFGFRKKTSFIKSGNSTKTTPRIDINSKTHFAYLRDVLHFIDGNVGFNPFSYKVTDENATAYLMGIIAGAGNYYKKKTKYSEWHQIQFKDKQNDYRSELNTLLSEFDVPYKTLDARFETYLNRKSTDKLLSFKDVPKITSEQIGLFTNPRHVNYIKENKLL